MSDPSSEIIGELIRDPRVDDTAGLDRARQSLPSEPLWVRAQRRLPFLQWRVFPGAWTAGNATAFIYYVLWGLPFAGVIGAVSAWRSPWLTTHEVARLGTVVVVCLAVNVFVLRDPVGARIGGIAGPAAILAAWIGARTWRTSPLAAACWVASVRCSGAGARGREYWLADEVVRAPRAGNHQPFERAGGDRPGQRVSADARDHVVTRVCGHGAIPSRMHESEGQGSGALVRSRAVLFRAARVRRRHGGHVRGTLVGITVRDSQRPGIGERSPSRSSSRAPGMTRSPPSTRCSLDSSTNTTRSPARPASRPRAPKGNTWCS